MKMDTDVSRGQWKMMDVQNNMVHSSIIYYFTQKKHVKVYTGHFKPMIPNHLVYELDVCGEPFN